MELVKEDVHTVKTTTYQQDSLRLSAIEINGVFENWVSIVRETKGKNFSANCRIDINFKEIPHLIEMLEKCRRLV